MLHVTVTVVERLAQVFLAATMALAVIAAVARRVRQRRGERRAAAERAVRPLLFGVIDDGADLQESLPPDLGRCLDDLALTLAMKLRGGDRATLVGLLRRRGVLDDALAGTTALSTVRRLRSVVLLGSLGLTDSLDALVARLRDRSPDVRRAAVWAIGRVPDARGAEALLDLLERPGRRPVSRHCITLALLRGGSTSVPPLIAALSAGAPAGRCSAAQVLGWMGELGAVDALVGLLDDAQEDCRAAAVEALGRIGAPTAAAPLRRCLSDTSSPVLRAAAATALGRLGDGRSAEDLTALLSEDHRLALTAAQALAALGPKGRQALLEHAVRSPEARDVLALTEAEALVATGAATGDAS